jgi:hypothetical protein
MRVINARSPYFIEVDEEGQAGALLKLWVWHKYETQPATATYTLQKNIASDTQTAIVFNISPYIAEQIETINALIELYPKEDNDDMWVYVYAEWYYNTEEVKDWELVRSIYYVGVQGFNNYLDGANQTAINKIEYLTNPDIIQYYNEDSTQAELPYFNVLIEHDGTAITEVKWTNRRTLSSSTITILDDTFDAGTYMFKIPAKNTEITNHNFGNDVIIESELVETILPTVTFLPVCEMKYTPVVCTFINRYGGWQFLNFWKAQTNNVEVKNSEFRLLPDNWDYNPLRNQTQQFNFVGTQSVKLNTGWVDENYSDLMFDLMASETILLDDKPANIKTKSMPIKTGLMDKMINYEVEFEYSYNLINDVV